MPHTIAEEETKLETGSLYSDYLKQSTDDTKSVYNQEDHSSSLAQQMYA